MAARLDFYGSYQDFYADNVVLTQRMLEASQKAGVKNFVMIGAAAVAIGSPDPFPLNEKARLIARPAGHCGTTKALAEKEVLSVVNTHLRRLVLRPPFVWAEDAPVFDSIAAAVQKGQFVWIDGARYCVATIHVENLASAILAALSSPAREGAFFVSDGADIGPWSGPAPPLSRPPRGRKGNILATPPGGAQAREPRVDGSQSRP